MYRVPRRCESPRQDLCRRAPSPVLQPPRILGGTELRQPLAQAVVFSPIIARERHRQMMCWGKSKSGWPRQGHQIPGHERLLAMKPKKLGRHETDKAPVPPLQDMTRTRFNRAADFHGLACRCQRVGVTGARSGSSPSRPPSWRRPKAETTFRRVAAICRGRIDEMIWTAQVKAVQSSTSAL